MRERLLFIVTLFFAPLFADPLSPQAYFSPRDSLEEKFANLVRQESKSIKIASYLLNAPNIIRTLKEARERGVDIEVIIDPSFTIQKSPLNKYAKEGGKVFIFNPDAFKKEQKYPPLMHHKFAIFESNQEAMTLLWVGSYDFSQGSEKDSNNVLLITNPDLIKVYLQEFENLRNERCFTFQNMLELKGKKNLYK